VGDKLTLADFFLFSFYLQPIRQYFPKELGAVIYEYTNVYRYFNWLKHHEFSTHMRQMHDKEKGISSAERSLMNEIYDFWYPIQNLNPEGIDQKPLFKIWYSGGDEIDDKCRVY